MSNHISSHNSGSGINVYTEENRKKLARLLMNLFAHWDIDTATQLNLLGLSANSRALLTPYKRGVKALPNTRDLFDRASFLLSIHKSLRLLYPKNENIRYSWVKRKNLALDHQPPLDIMTGQGILGLAKIARLLDFQRG